MKKILAIFIALFLLAGVAWGVTIQGATISGVSTFQPAKIFEFDVVTTQVVSGQFSSTDGIYVDWGDGSSMNTYVGTNQSYSHDYGDAVGTHTVKMYANNESVLTKYQMDAAGANVQFALSDLPNGVTYIDIKGSNTISGSLAGLPSGVTYIDIRGSNTVSGSLSDLPSEVTYVNIWGSNTISGSLSDLPSGVTSVGISGSNTVSGSLSDLLSRVTYVGIWGSNTVSGSLSDLPRGVTVVVISGSNTVSGSLSDLPSGVTYVEIKGSNTVSDYTTKPWTTKPAIFELTGDSSLSESEIDQLFIDFDDDLVWSAGNKITITGSCDAPSATSAAARANIASEGATITTN